MATSPFTLHPSIRLGAKPVFRAGQLLSDADLRDLAGWASDRFALDRFRDGWGVVSGLEVRPVPGQPKVVVQPGLALLPNGEDLVIPEPQTVDLADPNVEESCNSPRVESGGTKKGAMTFVVFGKFQVPRDEIRVIDLSLASSDLLSRPLPIRRLEDLGSDSVAARIPTRSSLEPRWILRPGRWKDRDDEPGATWLEPYTQWQTNFTSFLKTWQATGNAADKVAKLRERVVNGNSPGLQELNLGLPLFAFVVDWLDELKASSTESSTTTLWQIVFAVLMDERARAIEAASRAAIVRPESVPLGRVLLRAPSPRTANWRALFVLDNPPYRRPIMIDDSYPAPPGKFNLARWLGRPVSELRPGDKSLELTLDEINQDKVRQFLEQSPFLAESNSSLTWHKFNTGEWGVRVVGLSLETKTTPDSPGNELEPAPSSDATKPAKLSNEAITPKPRSPEQPESAKQPEATASESVPAPIETTAPASPNRREIVATTRPTTQTPSPTVVQAPDPPPQPSPDPKPRTKQPDEDKSANKPS